MAKVYHEAESYAPDLLAWCMAWERRVSVRQCAVIVIRAASAINPQSGCPVSAAFNFWIMIATERALGQSVRLQDLSAGDQTSLYFMLQFLPPLLVSTFRLFPGLHHTEISAIVNPFSGFFTTKIHVARGKCFSAHCTPIFHHNLFGGHVQYGEALLLMRSNCRLAQDC